MVSFYYLIILHPLVTIETIKYDREGNLHSMLKGVVIHKLETLNWQAGLREVKVIAFFGAAECKCFLTAEWARNSQRPSRAG